MKIWLDDIRPMLEGFDTWVKSADIAWLYICCGYCDYISFDHDLGAGHSGYDLAKVIEKGAFSGEVKKMGWDIHSANPEGYRNIQMAMKKAEEFWRNNE